MTTTILTHAAILGLGIFLGATWKGISEPEDGTSISVGFIIFAASSLLLIGMQLS
jgi:hypothetical protein